MSVDLTYRKLGEGSTRPPLVILHGLLGSAGNWRTIARQLEPGRRIYCLNLRNHGDSPHCAGMSYEAMAEDVEAFIRREALDRPDLVGHSMGGKVAMVVALLNPALIRKLTVVDIAPVAYTSRNFPMFDAIASVDLTTVNRREDADEQLQKALPDAMLRAFVLTNLRRGPSGYFWRINIDAINDGMQDILGFPTLPVSPSTVPTLFVGGAESDYLDGHDGAIKTLFNDVRVCRIDGAGHWPHADRPDETVRVIRNFLDGVEGDSC